VPSIFVGDAMFWGKDRMEFVEDELMKIEQQKKRHVQTQNFI